MWFPSINAFAQMNVSEKCLLQMELLLALQYFCQCFNRGMALVDRAGLVSIANDHMLKRKVGAAVVAVRRGGATDVFDAINKFFFISQMIVPGSVYWNMGFGLNKEEVKEDDEGINTMRILGENMAWLLMKIF